MRLTTAPISPIDLNMLSLKNASFSDDKTGSCGVVHTISIEITMHVSILTEISRVVEDTGLLQISALEQELACGDDHEYAIRV